MLAGASFASGYADAPHRREVARALARRPRGESLVPREMAQIAPLRRRRSVALHEARESGAKVPRKRSSKKSSRKKSSSKKSSRKKSSSKKSSSKKSSRRK
jgi:hypothetical protein